MGQSKKKKTLCFGFCSPDYRSTALRSVYSKFIEWAYGWRGIYFLKLRFFKINQEELIVLIDLFFSYVYSIYWYFHPLSIMITFKTILLWRSLNFCPHIYHKDIYSTLWVKKDIYFYLFFLIRIESILSPK